MSSRLLSVVLLFICSSTLSSFRPVGNLDRLRLPDTYLSASISAISPCFVFLPVDFQSAQILNHEAVFVH